jgi:hypothetical protein
MVVDVEKVAPPARKIRSISSKLILKIARELLIPTWGKIPEKMVLASITIALTGYAVNEFMEELGERIDVGEVIMFTKHIAEVNGVKNIDYNHNDVIKFLIENTKVRDDDTYMTYLKRVGVICLSILLKIYTTSAYISEKEKIAGLEEVGGKTSFKYY